MHTVQKPLSRAAWAVPALLLGVAAFLYANLFYRPGIPFLLSGDQTYFWTYAQRMFFGERPYLDFFQFSPAGANLVFLAFFRVFGVRIAVLNWIVLLLGVALSWIIFRLARRILDRGLALLATLLFLTLVYTRLLNATHHFFALLAILCAVSAMDRASSWWTPAAAGALLGCASFFTQTHGVAALVAFTAFILWDSSRAKIAPRSVIASLVLLWACFGAVVLLLNAHFLISAGVHQLWDSQVTYPRKIMAREPALPYFGLPEPPTLRRFPIVGQAIFVYLMLPVVYVLALFRCSFARHELRLDVHRDARGQELRLIALLSLTGLLLLLEVALSPNWLRIYTVSAPGFLLFVWLLATMPKAKNFALALVSAAMLCIGAQQLWAKHHHEYLVIELPSGSAATDPAAYEKLSWFQQRTSPGDFFLQAAWPGLYVPLALRNPVYADVFRANAETPPDFVAQAIRALDSKPVRYILWPPRLDGPDPLDPGADHLAPLRSFLRARYHLVWTFSDQEQVWQRN
jgi:hypothetical protein